MSSLLSIQKYPGRAPFPPGAVVQPLEFEVSPDTSPYLVTSSVGLKWVPEPLSKKNMVRAAVRMDIETVGDLFANMVDAVVAQSKESGWGNVFPYTGDGAQAAIQFLNQQGIAQLEMLVPPVRETEEGELKFPAGKSFFKELGLAVRPTSWLEGDRLLIVPKDRLFIGQLLQFFPKGICAVAHNLNRAICVVQG